MDEMKLGLMPLLHKIAEATDGPPRPESFSEEGQAFLDSCFKADPLARGTAAGLVGHAFVSGDTGAVAV